MLTLKKLIEIQSDTPDGMTLVGSKRNTKLMFHKTDSIYDPKYNWASFEEYQKEHWNNFFTGTKFVMSFWYEGKTARFVGCYKCNDAIRDTVLDNGKSRDRIRFPNMERLSFMDGYIDRLFVEWTNPTANYGRFIEEGNNVIHAILPSKDRSIGPLPKNFFEIHLPYPLLKKLFENPNDNSEWKNYLKSRCGVYYIDDTSDPENGRYVGSAYGAEGFWGRWAMYAAKKDGNKDFYGREYEMFVFSILWETLPNTSLETVIAVESEFKITLGTRVKGLNNN